MSYTKEQKLLVAATYAGLCKMDEIRPTCITGDDTCEVEMSEEAERKLAEVICKCDAFDAKGAALQFFEYELDHAHIGNRTALGITTGFFQDDWALDIPHSLMRHMQKVAVEEITEAGILDSKEIFQLVQHNPRWRDLHDEYERELAEHDEGLRNLHASADAQGILMSGKAA